MVVGVVAGAVIALELAEVVVCVAVVVVCVALVVTFAALDVAALAAVEAPALLEAALAACALIAGVLVVELDDAPVVGVPVSV